MKIYIFSWSWYEDYCPIVLLHTSRVITEWKFKRDCLSALRACGRDYLKNEQSWAGAHEWIIAATKYMCEHMGYTWPEKVQFNHFGSDIVAHNTINGMPVTLEDKKWQGMVGQKLYAMAAEKNRKLKGKLDRQTRRYRKHGVDDVS